MLLDACKNGSLEASLRASMSGHKEQDQEGLKLKEQSFCYDAAQDGSLEPAAQSFVQNLPLDMVEDPQLKAKATKIQSADHGTSARIATEETQEDGEKGPEPKVENFELSAAATKIQSTYRGNAARRATGKPKEVAEKVPKPEEDLELTAAATKIQSTYRGNAARRVTEKAKRDTKEAPEPPRKSLEEIRRSAGESLLQAARKGDLSPAVEAAMTSKSPSSDDPRTASKSTKPISPLPPAVPPGGSGSQPGRNHARAARYKAPGGQIS